MASIIIIIKGITPKDFFAPTPEETFHMPNMILQIPHRQDIPRRFCGVETWPTSSDLWCWHCGRTPTSYPKFVPQNPKNDSGQYHCDVLGNFDEWNCVIAYIYASYKTEFVSDMISLVYIFEHEFSRERKIYIPPSPPKTEMKNYCGESGLTEKEYGDKIAKLNRLLHKT